VLHFYNTGLFGGFYESGNLAHQYVICLYHKSAFLLSAEIVLRQFSNWIWFPLMQHELDGYITQRNAHHIRHQSDKIMPSGGRPDDFYRRPEEHGGQPCLIRVDLEEVDRLLEASEEGLYLMRYVDEEFDVVARRLYHRIGEPHITLETAWIVFKQMVVASLDED